MGKAALAPARPAASRRQALRAIVRTLAIGVLAVSGCHIAERTVTGIEAARHGLASHQQTRDARR